MKQTPETVVLLNFVCEDIQKIARGIRAEHIYTMCMPYTVGDERLLQEKPVGLIVCADANAPAHDDALARFKALGIPLLQLTIQKEIAEPLKKIHEMRRREFSYKTRGPVTKPNGGKTWSKTYRVPKEKLPEERETVELANEQNRALKTRVLEIRTALVEIEKAHGLPKDLLI